MNRRATLIITGAVLVGLALGATVLRDQMPVSSAQTNTPSSTPSAAQQALQGTPPGTAVPSTPGVGSSDDGLLAYEQNTIDIVKRYEPGLVYIATEQVAQADPLAGMFGGMGGGMGGGQQVEEGVGSGFFVNAAGDILTNFHVVRGADKISVRLLGQDKTFTARVIGRAPQYDLALIRPDGLPQNLVKPIPLGDSDTLEVGQKAIAMGAPFGLDFSVTSGIVSSTERRIPIGFSGNSSQGITQKAIQTDAAINPGNSGGPLLSSRGQVIGINTQIISPSGSQSGTGQSAGVGFAIPINAAKRLLPRLLEAKGGTIYAPRIGVEPGLLGVINTQQGQQAVAVGLGLLRPQARKELGLPASGLVVGKVSPGSPAAAAGIEGGSRTERFQGGQVTLGGDVITKVDGVSVDSLEDVQAQLIDKRQGDRVSVTVERGGSAKQLELTLNAQSFSSQP